ncbi:MAG: hypothetical protein U9R02_06785, partial [Thermodesulfobacteriota bacterium]|nr:hypothetical protein [Thermodesulfobacteriota bacterium]
RSSIAKVLEIARYSCGFVQSDRLNLRQIRAQILPSYFLPNPKGRGKLGPPGKISVPIKDIWLYPLNKNFRTLLKK